MTCLGIAREITCLRAPDVNYTNLLDCVDVQICGSSSWIIPLGLAMPYLWRLFQCIRVYKDTGNHGQVRVGQYKMSEWLVKSYQTYKLSMAAFGEHCHR